MSEPTPVTDLHSRSSFRQWTSVSIRYCDQDPLGHVNNAAMAAYIEQARVALIYPILRAHVGPQLDLVLARIVIDYVRELQFPGTVEIGTRVARLGTKSLTLSHSVFKDGSGDCAATAECAIVFFDLTTRRSVEPPGAVRAAIAALD